MNETLKLSLRDTEILHEYMLLRLRFNNLYLIRNLKNSFLF